MDKDRNAVLRVVCEQLQYIAQFNPDLLDEHGEPVPNVENTKILQAFQTADQEDQNKPPPNGPRIDRFVKRVHEQIGWHFLLLPTDLLDGSLPTIKTLVDRIMTT